MARRVRNRDCATTSLGRDGCGSALAQSLGKSSGATPAEDLWHDVYGSALARRLMKRSGETPA